MSCAIKLCSSQQYEKRMEDLEVSDWIPTLSLFAFEKTWHYYTDFDYGVSQVRHSAVLLGIPHLRTHQRHDDVDVKLPTIKKRAIKFSNCLGFVNFTIQLP